MEHKKGRLEDFIRENKAGFDDEEPPADLWNKVAAELPVKEEQDEPKRKSIPWMMAAGVALLVGVTGFLAYVAGKNDVLEDPIVQERQPVMLAEVSEEYAEVEHYYVSKIADVSQELKKLHSGEEVAAQMALLQEEYEGLKLELGTQMNNEKIVEAMIENYMLRLELLQMILTEVKEENKSKD